MSRDRAARLKKILELVTANDIATQERLAEVLGGAGWEVTQSSVSRDIAALGLVKVAGVYRRPRAPRPRDERRAEERVIAESVVGLDPAGDCLIVLHTPPGEANRVAVGIDRLAWPEVAGTIAGDDTIFVAARGPEALKRAVVRFRKLVAG